VKVNWEAIKAEERASKGQTTETASVLDDVPRGLPALARAQKLDKRAAQNGFDWPNAEAVLDKCREELDEVAAAIAGGDNKAVAEEIGDLLFAVTSLARHVGVEAEAAAADANAKFIRRFRHVEARCRQEGVSLKGAGMERLDAYWNEVREADSQSRDADR